MMLANLGRTGAVARDIVDPAPARRAASGLGPRVPMPDVRLPQLRPAQPAPEPLSSRNPFTFAARTISPEPEPSPVSIPQAPQALPDLPPSVALSLIGVATTTRADGRAERTAIIAGPADALYFVRDGDAVMTSYRVDAVLPDSVVLVDGTTGVSRRLVLR